MNVTCSKCGSEIDYIDYTTGVELLSEDEDSRYVCQNCCERIFREVMMG